MQYVNYGKTGLKVSRFGLGCMRFPESEKEAIEIVRYAVDHGVNYLDTAHAYEESERKVGMALKDGYRDKAYLVTKNPIWFANQYSDFEKYLDIQLKTLGVDYIDVYLLHNINSSNWEKMKNLGGFHFLEEMVQKGKIRYKACSYHGDYDLLKEVVDEYDWDMVQVQLNILDEFQQVGKKGIEYIGSKGMAGVIMEPLRGGFILTQCPDEAKKMIEEFPVKRSLLEWCFRWLYNIPEANVILSGSSTLGQLKQCLEVFENTEANVMDQAELDLMKAVRETFETKNTIGCTGCRYCVPCPKNVDIPQVFKLYNSAKMMQGHFVDKMLYQSSMMGGGISADRCVECGKCAKHCPQSIAIPKQLKIAHEYLSK